MTKPTIIVSGMGRCGTSLMMQMLQRGGVPCIGKHPDFETSKTMFGHFRPAFLTDLQAHAVKIIDPAKLPIPVLTHHVVIWLDRSSIQQAESQAKLLRMTMGMHIGRTGRRGMERSLRKERRYHVNAFGETPMRVVTFEDLIDWPPQTCRSIAEFLAGHGWRMDAEKMASCVVPRSSDCFDGLLESRLIAEGALCQS